VTSTIARKSLGVRFRTDFEEGIHRQEDKHYDDLEGIWKAINQMQWYLRKVRLSVPSDTASLELNIWNTSC
jgi:hypothetical protein